MQYNILTQILILITLFQLPANAKQDPNVSAVTNKNSILGQTTIKTIDGEMIQIKRTKNGLIFKGYEEKIILLEMFGHSCPPCKASIPGYNRLQKKHQKDVVVIAIEVWGSDTAGLKRYADTYNIHYKAVAKADAGKMLPFVRKLTGWNPGIGVPYLMLFAPGGSIYKDVAPQRLPESHVESLIQKLLK